MSVKKESAHDPRFKPPPGSLAAKDKIGASTIASFLNEKSFIDMNKSVEQPSLTERDPHLAQAVRESLGKVANTPEECMDQAIENRFGKGLTQLFIDHYGLESSGPKRTPRDYVAAFEEMTRD